MDHADVWDEVAASRYDTPGVGMFAPEVLDPTVDLLHSLAGGGRALEMAIGTGRVAIPLAATGVPVAGIELCQPMIDQLRTKASEEEIPVVLGDMRTARVDGSFDLVFLVYNGISNVLTQDGQIDVLENAARHLRPGGRLLIELWVPDLRTLPPGQAGSVFSTGPGYLGANVFDTAQQLVVSHHVTFDQHGDQAARVFRSPHRYIWPSELDLMARIAGFDLESRQGGWSDEPFTHETTDHVSVYKLG